MGRTRARRLGVFKGSRSILRGAGSRLALVSGDAECLALLITVLSIVGCNTAPSASEIEPAKGAPANVVPASPPPTPMPTRFELPVDGTAMAPNLTRSPSGAVLLSWIYEADGEGAVSLYLAELRGHGWSVPREIVSSSDLLTNWADFPVVARLEGGDLVASWHLTSGSSSFSYDIAMGRSSDDGQTWRDGGRPHDDGVSAEHGFVSIAAEPDGGYTVVWLDGRNAGEGSAHGATQLRARRWDVAGTAGPETVLDERVCDCCQTDVVTSADNLVVIYRDRSEREVRDISYVRRTSGRWSAPKAVHEDAWTIGGCPVNGPAIAAMGSSIAAAWFTGAVETGRVSVALSSDGAGAFSPPVTVDAGHPLGRVDVLMLRPGVALVTWMETDPSMQGRATIYARRVGAGGPPGDPIPVAATSAARASGFPRTAVAGDAIVWVWTDVEDGELTTVHGARLPISGV